MIKAAILAVICIFSVSAASATNNLNPSTYRIHYKVSHLDNHKLSVSIDPSITIRIGQTITMNVADGSEVYAFTVTLKLVDDHAVAISDVKITHDDTSVIGLPRLTLICDVPSASHEEIHFDKSADGLRVSAIADPIAVGA